MKQLVNYLEDIFW